MANNKIPDSKNKTPKKKAYIKPEIKSESILEAGLANVCNGTTIANRKSVGPCTILKT